MKKFIVGMVAWCMMAVPALAANECTYTTEGGTYASKGYLFVTVSCQAGAAAATFDNMTLPGVKGMLLYQVEYQNGATGPTDDSDLTLLTANSTDLLGGNGVDFIDNAASAYIIPETTGSDPHYPMATGALTQVIANNSVNAANFTLKYTFLE